MTENQLWEEFTQNCDVDTCEYNAWQFGFDADLLADLVLRGEKTATASAYPLYQLENEPLPKIGEYDIILNSKNEAMCIIKTTNVYVIPFCKVNKEHAYKEGEGDKSLKYWRNLHRDFFIKCLSEVDKIFDENMEVVCEEFKVVYTK